MAKINFNCKVVYARNPDVPQKSCLNVVTFYVIGGNLK